MERTGTKVRRKTLKEQRLDGELDSIVERFARAMWSAEKSYVGETGRFTTNLAMAWGQYIEFCRRNSSESR